MIYRLSALCLLLGALLLAAGCADEPDGVLPGYVEGRFTYVSAPAGGKLLALEARRGAKVEKGQPLFRLEAEPEASAVQEARWRVDQAAETLANLQKGARPSEIAAVEARLRKARAALQLSRLQYERRRALYSQKAIAKSEYDSHRAAYLADSAAVKDVEAQLATARLGARDDEIRAAEAELRARQEALGKALWLLDQKFQSAPLAALVFDTLYTVGEYAPAGSPVVALLAPGEVRARFFAPEALVGALRLGQRVELACDGCPAGLWATISYISPQAEYTPPVIYSANMRHKLSFMIEATPPPERAQGLHPGQPLDVTLPVGQSHAAK